MKDENSKKKPFFASFLEKQIQDPEKVQGGGTTPDTDVITSPVVDVITAPILDNATSPSKDHLITLKYPSDHDDSVN